MTHIAQTIQTPLRGNELRSAIEAEVSAMLAQRPFNMVRSVASWASSTNYVITAGSYADGAITIQDGNPSTVSAVVNLHGLAESFADDVRSALASTGSRLQAGAAASAASAASSSSRSAPGQGADIFANIAAGFRAGIESVFPSQPSDYGVPAPSPAQARREINLSPIAKTTSWVSEVFEDVLPGSKPDEYAGADTAAMAPPVEQRAPEGREPPAEFPWLWVLGGSAVALGIVLIATR